MRLHILQHVPFEGPALVARWADTRGVATSYTRFYEGTALAALDDFDALLVLGGPMGVYDTEKHPWMRAEMDLIRRASDANKPVFGICLGAQLIAAAFGAKVFPHERKEIGWFPVRREPGAEKTIFDECPETFPVSHWHGDTYELPSCARRVFSSEGCREQGFVINDKTVGLQFHLEANEPAVMSMADNLAHDLRTAETSEEKDRFVQSREELFTEGDHKIVLESLLFGVLDRWAETRR